jgi:membrane-associated HD superfamily phosphohydrolase
MLSKEKTAKTVSVLGHPLLFGNAYVVFMSFKNLESKTATLVSLLVIFLVVVPIIWNNWRKMKSGEYSNFDVSDRKQRMGFYPFAIGLFVVLLLAFWVLKFPEAVILQTLVFFMMVLTMALVNLRIKASMHAAIAFYIVVNIFGIGIFPGIISLVFALAVSWSRWETKRHYLVEIVIGSLLGLIFGGVGLMI